MKRFHLIACFFILMGWMLAGITIAQPTSPPVPLELPANPPDIANGARVYQANCTRCHGVNGAGAGELVASGEVPRMPSFLEGSHVRQQALEFYYDIISNGNLVNLMPPWASSLSVQERWDVLMYVYTLHYTAEQVERGASLLDAVPTELSLDSDAQLAAQSGLAEEDAYAAIAYQRVQTVRNWQPNLAAPITTTIDADHVTFRGSVVNGSANATLPPLEAIQLELHYGDFVNQNEVVTGTLDRAGQFVFEEVAVIPDATYFVVAFYDGRPFVSSQIMTDALQLDNVVDVPIYAITTAPNSVILSQLDLLIEYLTVPNIGTGLVITQLNTYTNATDRVFHLEPQGQNARVSLLVSLPIGALILDNPDERSFIPVQEQYALIDTRPIYPGEHTVRTSYFLPYEADAQTIDLRMNNRLTGEVSIVVANPTLNIASDQFAYVEDFNMGTIDTPQIARLYRGEATYQAGDSLVFDIEGKVDSNTSADQSVVTSEQLLPLLIGAGVLFTLIVGGVLFMMRRGGQSEQERLLNEISQLELLHDAGRINHDAYQQQRAELQAQLAALLQDTQDNT